MRLVLGGFLAILSLLLVVNATEALGGTWSRPEEGHQHDPHFARHAADLARSLTDSDEYEGAYNSNFGPNCDTSPIEAGYGAHQVRDPPYILSLFVEPSDNDTTFANRVCSLMTHSISELTVRGIASLKLRIPACLSSTNITSLTLDYLIVDNITHLPPNLETLKTSYMIWGPGVAPSSSAPSSSSSPYDTSTPSSLLSTSTGFDDDGRIVWEDLFSYCQNLTRLEILNSELYGSLPDSHNLGYVSLDGNPFLYGTIPPALFSRSVTRAGSQLLLHFSVSNAQLTGGIPDSLFQGMQDAQGRFRSITIGFSGNQLSGSLPAALLAPLTSMGAEIFTIDFSHNALSGSLPSTPFFPSGILSTTSFPSCIIDLSYNNFTGMFSPDFLATMTRIGDFSFRVQHNRLSGTLPSNLFVNGWAPAQSTLATMSLSFNDNEFSGTFPPAFLSTRNLTVYLWRLELNLAKNRLTSTLPESLFLVSEILDKRDTSSSESFLVIALGARSVLTVDFRSNELNGTLPAALLDSPMALASGSSLVAKLYLDSNDFEGTIPESLAAKNLTVLSVAGNTRLSGVIPSSLNQSTMTREFYASFTSLHGRMPITLPSLKQLHLAHTNIDFCSDTSANSLDSFSIPGTFSHCDLSFTSACNCSALYSMCRVDCLPLVPQQPVVAPSSPSSPPVECPSNTRPGSEFDCINGAWVASSVTVPKFTIPAGAGAVVVSGNLTSSSIIFNGFGSSINLTNGCASSLKTITIALTEEEIAKLGSKSKIAQTLISQNVSSHCVSLSNVEVVVRNPGKGCRKVEVSKAVSGNGNILSAFFTINSSGCNTWWIVLVSIIAAVVVLAAIAAAVAVTCHRKNQMKEGQAALKRGIQS